MDLLVYGVNSRTNFADAWGDFWDAVTEGIGAGALNNIMNTIGILLILFALLSYFWQHRRGTNWGSGSAVVIGALVFGLLMLAPNVVIPLILRILDWIVNIVLNWFQDDISGFAVLGLLGLT